MPELKAFGATPTKILAPIDFSQSSHTSLEMAADLADHFHAELHLVHVVPVFSTSTAPDFFPETRFIEAARKHAEGRFGAVQADLAAAGLKVSFSIEEGNDVASSIVEVIDRESIDMVVISTHGLTGWHPLVFGSIAEKVVKMAQCPLMLMRTPKPASSVKIPSGRLMEWW